MMSTSLWDAAQPGGGAVRKPLEEPDRSQPICHRDQGGEPDQDAPCLLVGGDIVPGNDPGQNHQCDHTKRHRDRGNPGTAFDPSHQRQQGEHGHGHLAPGDSAQGIQFGFRPGYNFSTALDLRRIEEIAEQGRGGKEQNADGQEALHPFHPRNVDVGHLPGDVSCKKVGRQSGKEHGAGDVRDREPRPHQIGPDLARVLVRERTVQRWNVLHHRVDGASAAGGVRRHERRQNQVGERDGIPQPEGALPQPLHQQERDPSAQSGGLVADGKDSSGEDEPHGVIGETGECPFDGFGGRLADEHECRCDGDADEPDGRTRQRFCDQCGDDGREQGKVMPGSRR